MARSARQARRTLAAASAVAGLLLACTSCTGSEGTDAPDGAAAANGKNPSSPSASPGKYRTLPEPCGAVPQDALDSLLPGAGDSGDPSEDPEDTPGGDTSSGGKATLTYDTDRRVGCEWSAESDTWNRRLRVDYKRVISYDPETSDEEQARRDYLEAAGEARVPVGDKGSAPPERVETSGKTPEGGPSTPSPSRASEQAPASALTEIGDEAFLVDRARDKAPEPHREVAVVFREENVLVKVLLRSWPATGEQVPDEPSLQVDMPLLAQELAKQLGEQ